MDDTRTHTTHDAAITVDSPEEQAEQNPDLEDVGSHTEPARAGPKPESCGPLVMRIEPTASSSDSLAGGMQNPVFEKVRG